MSFSDIWERINQETDLKTLTELAAFVGTAQPHVSRKKKNNDFPANWAYKISLYYGIHTDWIMRGIEPKRLSERLTVQSYKFPILRDVDKWLNELQKEMPSIDRNEWLKGELFEKIDAYRKWILRKEEEESDDNISPSSKVA